MFAAIDIGGTKTKISIAKQADTILATKTLPTEQNQVVAVEQMIATLKELSENQTLKAIGVASPGPIDTSEGIILHPGNIAWKDLSIVSLLRQAFDCPVLLEHDATAGGIAEARLGAGTNAKVLVYLSISTGVGMSILVDGKPLPTRYNSEGGKQIVGITSQREVIFELIASGRAILDKYGVIARDIIDPDIWDEIAKNLSVGLYNIATIVEPDAIVLGGGVAVHYDKFIDSLRQHMQAYEPLYPLPVLRQAKYVETAPTIGALILATQHTKVD